jgi:hypothetical protein
MPNAEWDRRLIKSPLEVWEELSSPTKLRDWLGEVQITALDPPQRLEWKTPSASGVIELEPLEWGTRVRVQAETDCVPAWERLQLRYALERSLRGLLDDLGKGSLKRGHDLRGANPTVRRSAERGARHVPRDAAAPARRPEGPVRPQP